MNTQASRHELAQLYLQRNGLNQRIAELEAIFNPRKKRVAVCGTDSGYYRHIRTLSEPACLACRNAHSDATRARGKS